MLLRLSFGDEERVVNWQDDLLNFPKVIQFDESKWEWAIYDEYEDKSICDYQLIFVPLKSYDSRYELPIPSLEEMFNLEKRKETVCECGAKYTSFPNIHLKYCPKWRAF